MGRCLRRASTATFVLPSSRSSSSRRSTPSMCSAWSCRSTVARGLSSRSPHLRRWSMSGASARSSMIASRSGGIESRAQRMASRSASAAVHADGDGAADDLGELLGEPGRHLGGVGVDDVAAVVVVDAGAGQGDEVGGREQRARSRRRRARRRRSRSTPARTPATAAASSARIWSSSPVLPIATGARPPCRPCGGVHPERARTGRPSRR